MRRYFLVTCYLMTSLHAFSAAAESTTCASFLQPPVGISGRLKVLKQSLRYSLALTPKGSFFSREEVSPRDQELWQTSVDHFRFEYASVEVLDENGELLLTTGDVTSHHFSQVSAPVSIGALNALAYYAKLKGLQDRPKIVFRYRHTHAIGLPYVFSYLSGRDIKSALAMKALLEAEGFANASIEMEAIYPKDLPNRRLGKHRFTVPTDVRWLNRDFSLKLSWERALASDPGPVEETQPEMKSPVAIYETNSEGELVKISN